MISGFGYYHESAHPGQATSLYITPLGHIVLARGDGKELAFIGQVHSVVVNPDGSNHISASGNNGLTPASLSLDLKVHAFGYTCGSFTNAIQNLDWGSFTIQTATP